MSAPKSGRAAPAAWLSIGLIVGSLALLPLGLRAVNAALPSAGLAPSFIPSVESPRVRQPFDREVVTTLREAQPDYIIIGDSMAGTRMHPGHFSRLVGGRGSASLLHPGTGSAYWYLAFKNYVVNARIKPKAVIIFFRDENLTEPMFRVYPGVLDRAAMEREAVLDRVLAANMHGGFYRAHLGAQSLYRFNRTRDWLEPRITRAPLAAVAGPAQREAFLTSMNERLFPLEALRPMVAADMPTAGGDALNFPKRVEVSLLPEILSLSHVSGIRVAFVRVQRRPRPDGPPAQSEALQAYVRDLAAYVRAGGGYFHDDWGDREQTLAIYEDGDHIARNSRIFYTELFFRRNQDLFR